MIFSCKLKTVILLQLCRNNTIFDRDYSPYRRSFYYGNVLCALLCQVALCCSYVHVPKALWCTMPYISRLEWLLDHYNYFCKLYNFYGHPYDCFPTGSNYIYIYIFCNIYILVSTCASMRCIRSLRKLRHSRGLGQLMGVARNRTRAQALLQ